MNLFFKKLSYIIVMLFIISLISFVAINLAPNSFFASGELNPNITPEAIAELKAIYGLDKPLYVQFFSWISSILQLDFGISFSSGAKVKDEILDRIGVTLILNVISMIFIFIISLYFGIKSAMKQNSFFDRFTKQLSLLSFSMPSFYMALVLVLIFSIKFELFPIAGLHSVPNDSNLTYYLDFAWHLALPIFIIVFL